MTYLNLEEKEELLNVNRVNMAAHVRPHHAFTVGDRCAMLASGAHVILRV